MAKNKKDLLSKSLSGREKPSDDEINLIAKEVHGSDDNATKEEKLKGLHVLLPLNDFDQLTRVAKKIGFPKKIIVLQALRDYFEKHGH